MVVILPSVRADEFLPGDDHPVVHVAAGELELRRLVQGPEDGPGLAVVPRVSVLLRPPEMESGQVTVFHLHY